MDRPLLLDDTRIDESDSFDVAPHSPQAASVIGDGLRAFRAPRIGIVGNPRSHSYLTMQSNPATQGTLTFPVAEPATREALKQTLSDFAANGVSLLVVQGGDGTLRDVLTLLPDCFADHPPEIAILATGNTNLAARVFGGIEAGPRGLARLAAAAQAGSLRRRTCQTLRVAWLDDPDRRPLRGLFFGAGLYAEGKRLADDRIHRSGVHNGPAVVLAVASALFAALVRRTGVLRQGRWRSLEPTGQAIRAGNGFVFLATTLDRLMLGFWPFGRGAGTGVIRWLDVDAPPRRLIGLLGRILLHRDPSSRRPEHRTGRSNRLMLRLQGSFVLDGEFFEPGHGGVVLSDGGAVTIVSA